MLRIAIDCSSITDFQQSTAISIAKKFRNLHIGRKLEFSAGGQMMLFAPRNYFSATIELLSCAKIRLSATEREREMQRLRTNLNTCPATHQFLRLYIFFQVLGQSSDFSEVFQKCRYHNHHHLSKPPNIFY